MRSAGGDKTSGERLMMRRLNNIIGVILLAIALAMSLYGLAAFASEGDTAGELSAVLEETPAADEKEPSEGTSGDTTADEENPSGDTSEGDGTGDDAITTEKTAKSSAPGMNKYILVTTVTTDEDGNTTTTVTKESSDSVNAGDTVTFKLVSNIPDYLLSEGFVEWVYDEEDGAVLAEGTTYVLTFHDVLDETFTLNENSITVTIGGVTLDPQYYTVVFAGDTYETDDEEDANAGDAEEEDSDPDGNETEDDDPDGEGDNEDDPDGDGDTGDGTDDEGDASDSEDLIITDGCTFELSIDLIALYQAGIIDEDDVTAAEKIVVTYTATLSENAAAGKFPNKSWVTYEGTKTAEKEVVVYTYGIRVYKVDSEGATDEDGDFVYTTYLAGAEFALYSDASLEEGYLVAEGTTAEGGILTFTGLAAGTYYLLETAAPDGYIASTEAQIITLPEVDADDGYVTVYVKNESGEELPSTGGTGTRGLTLAGLLLILLAAAGGITVSRRRQSRTA